MTPLDMDSLQSVPPDLIDAVLDLSPGPRQALARLLYESLSDPGTPPYPGWPGDWEEELERRCDEADRGETISEEEALGTHPPALASTVGGVRQVRAVRRMSVRFTETAADELERVVDS